MKDPTVSINRAAALLGTDPTPADYVILKIQPAEGGCCCFHCWPETWRAINRHIAPSGPIEDESDTLVTDHDTSYVLECHESGPEIVVYLTLATASIMLVKSIVDLITAFLKTIGKDRKHPARLKISKRLINKGKPIDETLVEIDLPLSEDITKKLQSRVKKSLMKHRFTGRDACGGRRVR